MGDAPTRRFDGTTVIDNPVGYSLPLGGIRLSFEDGEQGAIKVRIPFRGRVTFVRSIVTKALAASDAGTVTFASPAGQLAQLSHPASAALENERSATPSANHTIESDTDLTITTAKTTEGGKVAVDLVILRVAGP